MAYEKMLTGMINDIPNSPRASVFLLLTIAYDLCQEKKISSSALEQARAAVKTALRERLHA